MARAYSDDRREKFLSADEAGNIGLEKLTATFYGGRHWAAIPTGARPYVAGDGENLLRELWICPWLSQEML